MGMDVPEDPMCQHTYITVSSGIYIKNNFKAAVTKYSSGLEHNSKYSQGPSNITSTHQSTISSLESYAQIPNILYKNGVFFKGVINRSKSLLKEERVI